MSSYPATLVPADGKEGITLTEHVNTDSTKSGITTGALPLPESLRSMSQQEVDRMAKQVRWKLDLLIMPILVVLYILNYLDRQNIASARLANIERDLKLTTVQYQTCISLLFVGYISFQIPSNMVLGKLKHPAVYICCCTALWGIVSACTAAVQSFAGLVICRFFLGCVEAVFYCAAIFYLSEQTAGNRVYALRCSILYSGSQLGSAFGNLLAIGILGLDGAHGIEGWRWLFLIEGVLTVGLALIFAFILPNQPKTTHWLRPEQRDYLVYTLESEQAQQDATEQTPTLHALKMALMDPKIWLLMGILYFDFIAAAVNNFFPSVVSTLGYSRNITYCLTAPPYILCCIVIILNGLHSDRVQERFLHVVCPLIVLMLANVIAVSTTKTAPRYVAMMLMPASAYSASTITVTWAVSTINGPKIKRAIALAIINAWVNTPNIYSAYFYINPPRYIVAFSVNLVATVIALSFTVATYVYLKRQNARMDKGLDAGRSGPDADQIKNGYRYPL